MMWRPANRSRPRGATCWWCCAAWNRAARSAAAASSGPSSANSSPAPKRWTCSAPSAAAGKRRRLPVGQTPPVLRIVDVPVLSSRPAEPPPVSEILEVVKIKEASNVGVAQPGSAPALGAVRLASNGSINSPHF
ncbi:exported hypothetical protein [Candidatus Sulfopaludibacter sp. SbA3]|nr:exported hypothetical protein [Candidatus Sulfopaludibacter sp. SbA3]